jgi:hypothetical protein
MKTLLLALFLAICPLPVSGEIVNLLISYAPNMPRTNTLSVASNQIARVLYGRLTRGQVFLRMGDAVTYMDVVDLTGNIDRSGGDSTTGLPIFRGPAEIGVRSFAPELTSGMELLVIELVSATPVEQVSNTVVIPANTQGPVRIALESSQDLVNWTEAQPGKYGATTEKRFFRVRALEEKGN